LFCSKRAELCAYFGPFRECTAFSAAFGELDRTYDLSKVLANVIFPGAPHKPAI
jgi:hypothetical protein